MTVPPRGRWLAALLLSFAAVLIAAPPSAVDAQQSFELPSVAITAVVNPDASMDVTEVVTYRFEGGPFNFGIKTFERDLDRIGSFTAADEQGPLEVIPPTSSVSGQWEWRLREPTSDRSVTFTLTYRVTAAVEVGSDVADLNWMFISDDHPGIGDLTITVQLPPGIPPAPDEVADSDTTVVRGFGHGPRNGVVDVQESAVVATVPSVADGQFVEVRAVAPAEAFAVQGTEPLLDDILRQEREIADGIEEDEDKRRLGFVLTPLLAGAAALGTGVLWFTGGRERTSQEVLGEYWREPLAEKPAVAVVNLERGTVPAGPVVAGTLVDLAQRGYLRIVGETQQRFGPDKLVHRYIWTGKQFGPDVVEYERELLEMIFQGMTENTSEDVNAWARDHQTAAKAQLDRITGGVKKEYKALHYEEPVAGGKMAALAVLCLVVGVGSWILKSYTDNGIAWIGVGAAVAMFLLGSRLLANRTQAGVEAAARAAGLKKFLKDFSRLEDAPVGHLILWERYLVFAVALGVSADLVRGLEARVPQVVNDPAFGAWYVGTHGGRFHGFDQMESNGTSLAAASTPKNTSGSGGGFSGGSSGGGGGGGFGAR